jgi:hypothetical protein
MISMIVIFIRPARQRVKADYSHRTRIGLRRFVPAMHGVEGKALEGDKTPFSVM